MCTGCRIQTLALSRNMSALVRGQTEGHVRGEIAGMFRSLYGVFVLCLVLPVSAQTALTVPKDATGWFQRASDLMNLRMPGSAPFHMKVVFHALPGIEMTKKPQIVIGDGI